MKKYLCILILALCASLLPVSPALADTVSWVRITQDNTRFYRNPTNMDADIMFELEKSYYLKVVSEQSYFYQVELMDNDNGFVKIYGYVKKTDVTPCDTVPELPLYPAVYVSVTGSNAILYSACSTASQPLCSVFYGQQLNYYGSMTVANSKWYFVKTGETFAYINSAYASAPLINPHPTPLPGEETPEPEPVEPVQPDDYRDRAEGVEYGTVQEIEYYSEVAGGTKHATVLLPVDAVEGKRYPVLYLLHGLMCDESTWFDLCSAAEIVRNAQLFEGASEMIVVGVNSIVNEDEVAPPMLSEEGSEVYDKTGEEIVEVLKFMTAGVTQRYDEMMTESGIEHEFYLTNGGHDFSTWADGLHTFVLNIFGAGDSAV